MLAYPGVVLLDDSGPLAPTIRWIRDHYPQPLPNEVLAEHAAMSLRNFARVFKRETGLGPAQFVEKTACHWRPSPGRAVFSPATISA